MFEAEIKGEPEPGSSILILRRTGKCRVFRRESTRRRRANGKLSYYTEKKVYMDQINNTSRCSSN